MGSGLKRALKLLRNLFLMVFNSVQNESEHPFVLINHQRSRSVWNCFNGQRAVIPTKTAMYNPENLAVSGNPHLLVGEVLQRKGTFDNFKNLGQVNLELWPHGHREQTQGLESSRSLLFLLHATQDVAHGIRKIVVSWSPNSNRKRKNKNHTLALRKHGLLIQRIRTRSKENAEYQHDN